jgi:hypothetical protein
MKDWGFEVELNELKNVEWTYDKRTDETYHMMNLLEQRIGDQLYDPEPTFDGVLNSADRQKLVVLQYELNQVLDGYSRSLVKTEETMGDLKFTTAGDFVYPGSDPQV